MALELIPMLISLGAGAVGGNLTGALTRSGMGMIGRSLTGIIGGGGLAALLPMLGGLDLGSVTDIIKQVTASGTDITSMLKSAGGGAAGGGVLAALLGLFMGKKSD